MAAKMPLPLLTLLFEGGAVAVLITMAALLFGGGAAAVHVLPALHLAVKMSWPLPVVVPQTKVLRNLSWADTTIAPLSHRCTIVRHDVQIDPMPFLVP